MIAPNANPIFVKFGANNHQSSKLNILGLETYAGSEKRGT